MIIRDKHDHEMNIRRSRVTRRTRCCRRMYVLYYFGNLFSFCICNRDPIAILLSEDDKQARRWGLSHFGMSLSLSPAVHMESANVTAAMSFSTTKSVLCQPCTLSLWHWLNKIKTFCLEPVGIVSLWNVLCALSVHVTSSVRSIWNLQTSPLQRLWPLWT